MVTKKCRKCKYRGTLSSAIGESGPCCDYCFLTGHSRLKLPPREDGTCPAFEEGERLRIYVKPTLVQRNPRPPKMKYRHEQLLSLYRQGLNDAQIAAEVGAVPSTVRKWRLRCGYPSNYRRKENA